MLTSLLLSLSLLSGPGPAVAPVLPLGPLAARQGGSSFGCNKPKWTSRRSINRQLEQLGAYPLFNAHRACVDWMVTQAENGVGALGSEGRDVGATSMLALALLGTGSNVQAGVARMPLRYCLRALKQWQDDESGALGDAGREEYLLEQALALLALSEAYYSDDLPARQEQARKAAEALLAGRGPDRLWHLGGKDDAPVDALVTSLSGYALYAAHEAGIELAVEACEPILAWTGTVAEQAGQAAAGELDREEALLYAGALCARLFSAQVLQRSLANDPALELLASRVAAQVPEPPRPDQQESPPPRLAEADFSFLASLGLYQADNVAWGRCRQWCAAILLSRLEPAEDNEALGHFPPGNTGRLPGGRLGTTALRALTMQSGVREPHLAILVD